MTMAVVVLVSLLVPAEGLAQVTNAGFEDWTNDGQPTGWITTNIPGISTPITKTTSAHSGAAAVLGSVISVNFGGVIFPGVPFLHTGFNVSQRYAAVGGYYTFTSVGGDSLYGYALLYKQGLGIGVMTMGGRITRSSYQYFTSNIDYITADIPDSCTLWFGIAGTPDNGDTVHVGSSFKLDDLVMTGTASAVDAPVTTPQEFALRQNFPNPFNPTTVLSYQVPVVSNVKLVIYDVLGREVALLVNGVKDPGSYSVTWNASGLASGVYLCRLESASGVKVGKMILQK
jgi:hypothetical protein